MLDADPSAHEPSHDLAGVDLHEVDSILSADILVPVDGHEDVYAATDDLDDDGRAESVVVPGGEPGSTEGGYTYSDTTGDGVADTLTQHDAHGGVVGQAVHDPASGDWYEVAPGSVDLTGAGAGNGAVGAAAGDEITVATPDGPQVAGVATHDTDGDGTLDTAVTQTVDGTTLLVTDLDGDHAADVVTEVASDGGFTTYTRTGDDEWTETDHGSLADPSGQAAPVTTDPATGEWV